RDSYAGLRPAGRDGVNYLIGASRALPGLINVAAIRSTGLSASLAIGEHVARLLAQAGIEGGRTSAPPAPAPPPDPGPWWERAARHHAGGAGAR
ncbi:MAG TPA: hypothetical protein VNZ05_07465, partial [Solirubrobacteraceae bacterium]|nr:hypothetical protein [Solirubrobacteraceae bacterium]